MPRFFYFSSQHQAALASGATVLLGLSAQGGIFTETLVETVHASATKAGGKGVIFPLSNPTANAECTARQAHEWTGHGCVFASGSPFPPVSVPQTGDTFQPSQANNMFIFPGLGLGASIVQAQKITDETLLVVSMWWGGAFFKATLVVPIREPF